MPEVRVRQAQPADLDVVRAIFRSASLWNAGDRETLLAHPDVLVLPADDVVAGRTRVAIDGEGQVVGFATVRHRGGRSRELEDLFVEPGHMRRGIATLLVQDLLVQAAAQDVDHIGVTANHHAMAFYRSVGFVDDGVSETRFGPASRMRLDVRPP
ncbi:MAG TPA: GNAT family N-acetyltransferase [Pseudonocardia sp.]